MSRRYRSLQETQRAPYCLTYEHNVVLFRLCCQIVSHLSPMSQKIFLFVFCDPEYKGTGPVVSVADYEAWSPRFDSSLGHGIIIITIFLFRFKLDLSYLLFSVCEDKY